MATNIFSSTEFAAKDGKVLMSLPNTGSFYIKTARDENGDVIDVQVEMSVKDAEMVSTSLASAAMIANGQR
jgi:hypothetical protein